jgi:hypothetical protein
MSFQFSKSSGARFRVLLQINNGVQRVSKSIGAKSLKFNKETAVNGVRAIAEFLVLASGMLHFARAAQFLVTLRRAPRYADRCGPAAAL